MTLCYSALNPVDIRDDLRSSTAVLGITIAEFDVGQNIEPFATMETEKVESAVYYATGIFFQTPFLSPPPLV
jgi:hypothetical protein